MIRIETLCAEPGLLVAGPWPLDHIDLVDDGEKSYPAGPKRCLGQGVVGKVGSLAQSMIFHGCIIVCEEWTLWICLEKVNCVFIRFAKYQYQLGSQFCWAGHVKLWVGSCLKWWFVGNCALFHVELANASCWCQAAEQSNFFWVWWQFTYFGSENPVITM